MAINPVYNGRPGVQRFLSPGNGYCHGRLFYEVVVTAKIRQYADLICPYVVGAQGDSSEYSYLTNGAAEFDTAITNLLNHVSSRQTTVKSYLNSR